MKYILGLSFLYKKYKKNATIRIFSNNRLVDELLLDKDIDITHKTYSESLTRKLYNENEYSGLYTKMRKKIASGIEKDALMDNPGCTLSDVYGPKTAEWIMSDDSLLTWWKLRNSRWKVNKYMFPSTLFLFEIDEHELEGEITIECINNDNNYTNGFMTKWSYIKFYNIFLLPKKALTSNFKEKILPRLYKNGQLVNFRSIYQKQNCWPSAGKEIEYVGNTDIDKLSYSIYQIKLGGQFQLKIPVIKKHNIKLFADKNRQHGIYLLDPLIVCYFSYYDLINRVNED
jgi:hypothetical protein